VSTYTEVLAHGPEVTLAQKDAEISALRQIAHNLATTLELNQLGGIASLRQQMEAHGLQGDA
jgi:hypothetical protein